MASSGKPRILSGRVKNCSPRSAGDRYVTLGCSSGPVTRTGIPSTEPPRIAPTMGIRSDDSCRRQQHGDQPSGIDLSMFEVNPSGAGNNIRRRLDGQFIDDQRHTFHRSLASDRPERKRLRVQIGKIHVEITRAIQIVKGGFQEGILGRRLYKLTISGVEFEFTPKALCNIQCSPAPSHVSIQEITACQQLLRFSLGKGWWIPIDHSF